MYLKPALLPLSLSNNTLFKNFFFNWSPKTYIPFTKKVYTFCSKDIYLLSKMCWPFSDYFLSFSYFAVASIALSSAPGRNWILLPVILLAVNFASVSAPVLDRLTWKDPKSPNLTIFPSERCLMRSLLRSLSTASISESETVDPAAAISFAKALKLISPSAFAEA